MTPTNIHFAPLANAAMLHPSGLNVGLATLGVVTLRDHEELSHFLSPLISHFETLGFGGPKPVMNEILRSNGKIRFEYWGQVAQYLRAFSPHEFQTGVTARFDMEDPEITWKFDSVAVNTRIAKTIIYERNRGTLDSEQVWATIVEMGIYKMIDPNCRLELDTLQTSPVRTSAKLFEQFVPMHEDNDWDRFLNTLENLCGASLGQDWHKKNFDRGDWPSQFCQLAFLYDMASTDTSLFVKIPAHRYQKWFDAQKQLAGSITSEARASLVNLWKKQFQPFLNEIRVDAKTGKVEMYVNNVSQSGKVGAARMVEASDAEILERIPYTLQAWFYTFFRMSILAGKTRYNTPQTDKDSLVREIAEITETRDRILVHHGQRPQYPKLEKELIKLHKHVLIMFQRLDSIYRENPFGSADEILLFSDNFVLLRAKLERALADSTEASWQFWTPFIPILMRHIYPLRGGDRIHISQSLFNLMTEANICDDFESLFIRLKKIPVSPNWLADYYAEKDGIAIAKGHATPEKHRHVNPEVALNRATIAEARRQDRLAKARKEGTRRAREAERLAAFRAEEAAAAAAEEEALRIVALRNQMAAAAQAAAEAEEKQRNQHFSVFQSHGTRLEKLIGDIEVMLLELCDAGKVSVKDLGFSWISLNGGDKLIPLAPELKQRRKNLRGDFEKAMRYPLSTTNTTDEILKSSHALLEEAIATKRDLKEAAKSR